VEARVASMKAPTPSNACSNFEPVHPQFFAKKCKTCGEDISAHGASTEETTITSPQPKSRRGSKIQAWEKKEDTPSEEPKEKPAVQTGKLKMLDMWKDKSTSTPEEATSPPKKDDEGDVGLRTLRAGGGGAGSLKAQWEAQASSGTSSSETQAEKPKPTGKFVVNTPLCSICQKACYPQEAVTYDKQLYHKSCFRCLNCKNEVSISAVAMIQGKLYCKTCFQRLFKTRGKYDDL